MRLFLVLIESPEYRGAAGGRAQSPRGAGLHGPGTQKRSHSAASPRRHNRAMLMYPQINPVALQLGPVAIHWYGLTYLAAFALFFFLGTRRLRHEPFRSI